MEIFAVILIFLGIVGIRKHLRIIKNGVHVIATVTEIKRSTGRNKYDNVYMTFQTEDGHQITGRSDEALNKYKIGNTVEIIYLQNNPTKVYTSSGVISGYVVLIIGIVLLIIIKSNLV